MQRKFKKELKLKGRGYIFSIVYRQSLSSLLVSTWVTEKVLGLHQKARCDAKVAHTPCSVIAVCAPTAHTHVVSYPCVPHTHVVMFDVLFPVFL